MPTMVGADYARGPFTDGVSVGRTWGWAAASCASLRAESALLLRLDEQRDQSATVTKFERTRTMLPSATIEAERQHPTKPTPNVQRSLTLATKARDRYGRQAATETARFP